jgi:tRNA 5-methylaminomethyl-2-thiouridine biosynthesis bifunctional protein
LLDQWVGQPDFQVLDLRAGPAAPWPDILAIWRAHAQRPLHLHWVSVCADSAAGHVDVERDGEAALGASGVDEHTSRAVLTKVTGELHAALRELRMTASALLLPSSTAFECTPWTAKLLARLCQRGTWLFAESLTEPARLALAAQGFELQRTTSDSDKAAAAGASTTWRGQYNPRWEPRTRAPEARQNALTRRHCIVIGAGLAGAGAAWALAARGWAVQMLDAGAASAAGASSLPVGLMVAHTSVDDNPRSRLTRAGVRLTTLQASRWLQRGVDWDHKGVLTRKPGTPALFRPDGVWIKPQALVEAWMAQPGVRFTGGAKVAALDWRDSPLGGEWRVLDADGQELAAAPCVVLAAAAGSSDILRNTAALQVAAGRPSFDTPTLLAVPGQVSWGFQVPSDAAWAPHAPVNGQGYLAANLPIDGQMAWLTGATFEDEAAPLDTAGAHAHNLLQLQGLLPEAAAALQSRFESGSAKAWRGLRCTTADRLPLLGPIGQGAPGLWLNTGYGARGLTWSVLCAELLAARLNGEPWPIAASLADKLADRRSLHG